MDGGRRNFLKVFGGAALSTTAASFIIGAWLRSSRGPDLRRLADLSPYAYYISGPLRPPGAVAEKMFLKRCTQCFLCAEVCPPKAVQFFGRGGGGITAHTPYVIPRERGCILCMKCTKICPSGALLPLEADEIREVHMGAAELDKRMCLPWIRQGWCEACYRICPLKDEAITQISMLRPEVHADKCNGCGLCEEICPVKAKAIRVRPLTTRA
jgi:MauM/NapG family ferredoxin protein